MPIYEITADQIRRIEETTFANARVSERNDLQRLLREQIDVISPNTIVVAEEFGEWEDSRRRIDLLGIDKQANLVVVELKRTEDGGHMELQAIRYAAMVSTMTFEKVVEVFGKYLQSHGKDDDPQQVLLEFLEWEEPTVDEFAQDVRIVLASAEFSRELTTSVMWLNDMGLDITCMRLKPYNDSGRVLLDVQQIIPLPEAEDYRVRVREKQEREREARRTQRDLSKFDVTIFDHKHEALPKRIAVLTIIKHLCSRGVTPEEIVPCIPGRSTTFCSTDGIVPSSEFVLTAKVDSGGIRRYFCDDEDLIHSNGRTYAVASGWGNGTVEAIESILAKFPDKGVTCEKHLG